MPNKRVLEFYDCQSFAIVGMSRSRKHFGWIIFTQLAEAGKRVYAVNPHGGIANNVELYESLDLLPETPEAIIVCTSPENTKEVLDSVHEAGAKYVWFQQGSYDEETMAAASRLGIDPIKGCAMMYMPNGQFVHRFHKAINELFGKGYK